MNRSQTIFLNLYSLFNIMKQLYNLKATVLIYTIVLVNISLLMAIVMLNNSTILSSNREVEILETKLTSALKSKAALNIKYHKTLNSNGTGFIDIIWCPQNVTMSGTIQRTTWISTRLTFTGWLEDHCIGTHVSTDDITFFFNDTKDDLEFTRYQWQLITISSLSPTNTFLDSDATFIDLTDNSHQAPDNIDDDYNSDDYRVSSTGSLGSIIDYPEGYSDDDSLARAFIYGYVSPDAWPTNVFWSNTKTNNYIESNTNNDTSIYTKTSTSSWYIYLDLDRSFDIEIVEFDRSSYDNFSELRVSSSFEFSSASWALWYIQTNGSLSWSIVGW